MTPRDMTPRDRRYVVPTWVKSSHYELPMVDRWRLVDRILDGGARVVVLSTNASVVHAWAAGAGAVLHYVYVPPELRGEGLARLAVIALLGQYPGTIRTSHPWPRDADRFRLSQRASRNVYALLRDEAA